jgi:uncharacterized FlaG/YvyC family protein
MRTEALPALSTSLQQTWPTRVQVAQTGGEKTQESLAAQSVDAQSDARKRASEENAKAAQRKPLVQNQLMVELDEGAGRFVTKIINPDDKSVVNQFPYESQLAFSRAYAEQVNTLVDVET